MTGFVAQAVVMEFVLALALGLIGIALYKAPKGEWLFPAAMVLIYIVVERVVAVDPSKLQMWIAPPVASFVIFAIGRGLYKVKPVLPGAVAALLVPVFLLLPIIADSMREEESHNIEQGDAPAGAPDVLMIVMDTVRSQSSSAYGYERDTTPTLDKLAEEGVLFMDAYAPATWSLPAHAALFTGTFPSWNNAHGETRYLDGKLPTIAEFMGLNGWETYAFSAYPHISPSFGLTRGFMHNDKAWAAGTSARNFSFIYRIVDALGLGMVDDKGGAVVVDNIATWMEDRPQDDRPAFVFVNFLEAHFPFRQLPKEFRNEYQNADMNTLREIDQIAFGVQFGRQLTDEEMTFIHQPLIDLYDGGVKYTDYLVGQVIDEWRKAGRLDNTIVVVLADHGEQVGEHGAFGHVTPVLEQDFRVPLLIRYPDRIAGGSKVTKPVSTVGTFATIMDLAGVDTPGILQVDTLMPGLDGEEVGQPILAERFEEEMLAARFAPGTANGKGPLVNPHGRYRVWRSDQYKFVQHADDGHVQTFLYDLRKDPGETRELAASKPKVVERLRKKLEGVTAELGLPPIDAAIDAPKKLPEDVDEAELEALRALGYIE